MQSAQNLNQIIRKNCSSGTSKNDCTPLIVQSRETDSQNVELSMSFLSHLLRISFLNASIIQPDPRLRSTARSAASSDSRRLKRWLFSSWFAVPRSCVAILAEAAGMCDASDFSLPENEPEQPHWELPSLGFALNGHCLRHWYARSHLCFTAASWTGSHDEQAETRDKIVRSGRSDDVERLVRSVTKRDRDKENPVAVAKALLVTAATTMMTMTMMTRPAGRVTTLACRREKWRRPSAE